MLNPMMYMVIGGRLQYSMIFHIFKHALWVDHDMFDHRNIYFRIQQLYESLDLKGFFFGLNFIVSALFYHELSVVDDPISSRDHFYLESEYYDIIKIIGFSFTIKN
jgi:hypothetical protein